ncbi:MAG: hypothetical protein ACK5V3_07340 [Bdellovibrionales bacterium]
MTQLLHFVDRANERIWMKMANFLDHYLPPVRDSLARKLILKPSEEVQLRVLEFASVMGTEELSRVLKLARKSPFSSVRHQAAKLEAPRPR